jgi:hypothetical protein
MGLGADVAETKILLKVFSPRADKGGGDHNDGLKRPRHLHAFFHGAEALGFHLISPPFHAKLPWCNLGHQDRSPDVIFVSRHFTIDATKERTITTITPSRRAGYADHLPGVTPLESKV